MNARHNIAKMAELLSVNVRSKSKQAQKKQYTIKGFIYCQGETPLYLLHDEKGAEEQVTPFELMKKYTFHNPNIKS